MTHEGVDGVKEGGEEESSRERLTMAYEKGVI